MNEKLQRQQIEHNSYLIRLNLVGDCAQEAKKMYLAREEIIIVIFHP